MMDAIAAAAKRPSPSIEGVLQEFVE